MKKKIKNIRIHKEGQAIVIATLIVFTALYLFLSQIIAIDDLYLNITCIGGIVLTSFVIYFFRNPFRSIQPDQSIIYAPADGRIVDIGNVFEKEFLKQHCLKISIFMSIWDVHVNRYPLSGKIIYTKYHSGNYFIARHPKPSELNENQTIVIKTSDGISILIRQIAGFLARRIICYAKVGEQAIQGNDIGFIRFGSRVDMYLPLHTEILVKMNEKIKGNKTIIARLKQE